MLPMSDLDAKLLPTGRSSENGQLARVRYPATSLSIITLVGTMLGGCGGLASQNSPDLVYADDAAQARELQVPPDLTDISDAEQFVLPGNRGSAVARNTLLPEFESIQFVRQGEQSWLRFDQAPENLWPQLLAFARKERFSIDQTEPAAGTIVSRWRAAGDISRSNLLQNLIGDDEQFIRIAFRLERAGEGARLFARVQAASAATVENSDSDPFNWPKSSHRPESSSALLARLLVFLGVEEQRARGILNDEQISAVLDNAVIQSTAAGTQLLLNYGFQSSYERVKAALESLDYQVVGTDDGLGRIEMVPGGAGDAPRMIIDITAEHVSAASVSVQAASGQVVSNIQVTELLEKLQQILA